MVRIPKTPVKNHPDQQPMFFVSEGEPGPHVDLTDRAARLESIIGYLNHASMLRGLEKKARQNWNNGKSRPHVDGIPVNIPKVVAARRNNEALAREEFEQLLGYTSLIDAGLIDSDAAESEEHLLWTSFRAKFGPDVANAKDRNTYVNDVTSNQESTELEGVRYPVAF